MFVSFKEHLRKILAPHAPGVDFDINYPDEKFGHYSANAAFGLAKKGGKDSMRAGGEIVSLLHKDKKARKIFSEISVASPGFINFTVSEDAIHKSLRDIVYHVFSFAKSNSGGGKKVNIEFVSANPTGPLTLGNGRSAAYGNALAKILDYLGYRVTKEYFINDVGNQMEIMGESVARRFLQLNNIETDYSPDLYQGKYITEIAKQMKKEGIYHGALDNFDELKEAAKKYALEKNISQIKNTLHKFGLDFDVWFKESDLANEIKKIFEELEREGLLYEAEGATWFRGIKFGLDKDVVLRKSTGEKSATYLASDFAYAKNKLSRGFDLNIYILGADHHGDVQRIKAGIKALGLDESKFKFLLHQLVALKNEGKTTRMSKRKGRFIMLDELMEKVPLDVIYLFFLMKTLNSHIDFDMELAGEESKKNPVYYIQYAHARIKSLLRNAKEKKIKWSKKPLLKILELLKEKEALRIAVLMGRFPEILEVIPGDLQVHRLADYLYELASAIHLFYDRYRIIEASPDAVTYARINLLSAAGEILRQGLALLGMSAPEKM